MDRNEFAKKYRYEPEPIDIRKYQGKYERRPEKARNQTSRTRYTAQKGTAHRASKGKKKINVKLAALIMAAAVGIGGISLANSSKQNEELPNTITQMQEEGINPESRGLSTETIELFEKYDEYFENFVSKKQNNLTDNDIISMISEIREMHFSTVKEKMGALIGEDAKNITMYYGTDKSDGNQWATIIANKDSHKKVSYSSNNDHIFGIGNKNHIPSELADVIRQLSSLDDLRTRVIEDRISKVNAVKELQELYESLEEIATGEFIQDEKGNISIIHYDAKEIQQDSIENKGRELDD